MFASTKYDKFKDSVEQNFGTKVHATVRNELTSMTIAFALSSLYSVPTAPVDGVGVYFTMNCLPKFLETIGEINERMVVDINQTREYLFSFWSDRYYALHRAERLKSLSEYTPKGKYLDITSTIQTSMTEDQFILFKENGVSILRCAVCLMEIVEGGKDGKPQ